MTFRYSNLFLVASLLMVGCTTLRNHEQTVKISSYPEGADVYAGSKYLGKTPGFFKIPRQRETFLVFKRQNYLDERIHLDTSYRWGDSFFSNFSWFIYGAPIGWGLDFATGTAWDYPSKYQADLKGKVIGPLPPPPPPTKIVIAPPIASSESLSNELQKKLLSIERQKYPKVSIPEISDYDRIFSLYNYTNEGGLPDGTPRDRLYAELETSHMLVSTVEEAETKIVVKSKLINIFTDEVTDSFEITFTRKELKAAQYSWFQLFMRDFAVSVFPNTIAIASAKSQVGINASALNANETYRGQSNSSAGLIQLVEGIKLKNAPSPKLINQGLKPVFRLTSNFSITHDEVSFVRDYSNRLGDQSYDWYTASMAYGPELGIESPVGYFYIALQPGFNVDYIKGGGFNAAKSSIGLAVEGGYLVFVSQRINLRFYATSITSNSDLWSRALSNYQVTVPGETVNHGSVGLAVGYYFPDAKHEVVNWMDRD